MRDAIGVIRAERLSEPGYLQEALKERKAIFEATKKANDAELASYNKKLERLKSKKGNDLDVKFERMINSAAKFKHALYKDTEGTIFLALDRNKINRENIDLIKEFVNEYSKQGYVVKVAIDDNMKTRSNNSKVNYVYTKEEYELLNELNEDMIARESGELLFNELEPMKRQNDYLKAWKMSQVQEASKNVSSIVAYIKKSNFSPFEAMLYIHKWVTTKEYKARGINLESGRVLPSIFKGDYIVCSGYATLVKAVVDQLDMPGLKCDLVGSKIIETPFSHQGHCHNLIHIDDPKYQIKGTYVEDACWDSADNEEQEYARGKGYSCCLYPVEDVMHFENKTRYYNEAIDSRYDSVISDSKSEKIKKSIKGPFKEIVYRMVEEFRTQKTPYIVKMYGGKSEPIPITKYISGLKAVYASKYNDPQDLEKFVKRDIALSCKASPDIFSDKANNVFSKQVSKKERKSVKREGPKAVL